MKFSGQHCRYTAGTDRKRRKKERQKRNLLPSFELIAPRKHLGTQLGQQQQQQSGSGRMIGTLEEEEPWTLLHLLITEQQEATRLPPHSSSLCSFFAWDLDSCLSIDPSHVFPSKFFFFLFRVRSSRRRACDFCAACFKILFGQFYFLSWMIMYTGTYCTYVLVVFVPILIGPVVMAYDALMDGRCT